jgi:hypothetical protein
MMQWAAPAAVAATTVTVRAKRLSLWHTLLSCSSCTQHGGRCVPLPCHACAATQAVPTCVGRQRLTWCQGAAACVLAAARRATAPGLVRGYIGSSTSQCAQHWLQLLPQLHDSRATAIRAELFLEFDVVLKAPTLVLKCHCYSPGLFWGIERLTLLQCLLMKLTV